jgi:CRP/FNR family transcriptional regulator, anaerobic regulatory protein
MYVNARDRPMTPSVLPAPSPARRALAAMALRLAPLGADALVALDALAQPRTFAPGAPLLRAGEQATWSFFIHRGLVRELYVGEHGEEHTRAFIGAGDVTGSLLDLLSAGPAVTFIEALEPTAALALRYRDFDALCARFPELNHLARRLAEAAYVRKARREYEMLALPAARRHARWLEEHAALDACLSRRHVASYLGITPEHLSRLRRAAR